MLENLVGRIEPGSRLLRTWELEGGVSAQVTAFEIERVDGRTEKLIVRRHGTADLRRNPRVAANEFMLLQLLESAGVAAPDLGISISTARGSSLTTSTERLKSSSPTRRRSSLSLQRCWPRSTGSTPTPPTFPSYLDASCSRSRDDGRTGPPTNGGSGTF
jgi:hypothetical protein